MNMLPPNLILKLVVASFVLIVTGCMSPPVRPLPFDPQERIVMRIDGEIFSLYELLGERYVFSFSENGTGDYWIGKGHERTKLTLPSNPQCKSVDYDLQEVYDGRTLIFIQRCYGLWPDRPLGIRQIGVFIVSYDLLTGIWTRIFQEAVTDFGIRSVSLSPNFSQAVAAAGAAINDTIFLIDVDGEKPLDLTISNGFNTWTLKQSYDNVFSENLNRSFDPSPGITRGPAWSHDGKTIAFWRSASAAGKSGISRLKQPYDLIFYQPDTGELSVRLERFYEPGGLTKWSPDDRFLLFSAQGHNQPAGLWLYDTWTDASYSLSDSFQKGASWAVSENAVITARCEENSCDIIKLQLTSN